MAQARFTGTQFRTAQLLREGGMPWRLANHYAWKVPRNWEWRSGYLVT